MGFSHLALFAVLAAALPGQTLVEPGAEVKKVAGGFRFTEGPAVDAEGNVYFSDIPNSRIHRIGVDGKVSLVREKSGGANGLMFAKDGRLLACEGKARRVTAMTESGKVTTLASTHGGKPLNSPNDLWIDPAGGVWFTDPRYGKMDGLQQGGFHVYYLAKAGSEVVRVIDDLVKPNGIIGTRDGKTLYVADPGAKKTYAYTVEGRGKLSGKRLFAETGSDGMTLDAFGNLYITAKDVLVYAPSGKLVSKIPVPERPSNVCFGGKDRKTLFITARTSVYSLAMTVAGQ